jgi:DNA polymerase-3 subunit delta'
MIATNSLKSINVSILARFAKLIAQDRLAHAYLFVGPKDVGKTQTALRLAKLVNCERNPNGKEEDACGVCPSCVKIEAGNHPDVVVIGVGEEETIKIARVRELIQKSQMKPYEARKKVFIIKDVENLSLEGSNALLKTLEEPAANTLLILTTSVLEKNLGTVRSRCHAIHFFPLSQETLSRKLKSDLALEEKASHFFSYFCDGCIGKAERLSQEGFFLRKNDIIDKLLLNRNNEIYVKEALADKDQTRQVLSVILTWFRDLLLLKNNIFDARLVVHADRMKELASVLPGYSFSQVEGIIDETVNTTKLLADNLNVKIPFSLLMEKIWVK